MEKRGVCPGENEEPVDKKAADCCHGKQSCGDDLLSRMADAGKAAQPRKACGKDVDGSKDDSR